MADAIAESGGDHHRRRRRIWTRVLVRLVVLLIALGCFLFISWMSGCMERMFYYPERGATPPPRQFFDAEGVRFQSADGTELYGWFIPAQPRSRSAAEDPDALPLTVLHVHGNAGNITSHIGFTDYLPRAGFNLFLFDYRGYGQSEGRPRKRQQLIDDTHAALDTILQRDDVDPDNIAMYGQSLGGSIGLNVMRDRPEIKAAVIESAFTSWRDIAANAVGGKSPGFIARTLAAILIPDSHRPIDAVAEMQRPIFLIHGSGDSIIPVSHGREFAAANRNYVIYHELEGGEHNSLRFTHDEVDDMVISFLRGQEEQANAADPIETDTAQDAAD